MCESQKSLAAFEIHISCISKLAPALQLAHDATHTSSLTNLLSRPSWQFDRECHQPMAKLEQQRPGVHNGVMCVFVMSHPHVPATRGCQKHMHIMHIQLDSTFRPQVGYGLCARCVCKGCVRVMCRCQVKSNLTLASAGLHRMRNTVFAVHPCARSTEHACPAEIPNSPATPTLSGTVQPCLQTQAIKEVLRLISVRTSTHVIKTTYQCPQSAKHAKRTSL
jgi:hypothetical protein